MRKLTGLAVAGIFLISSAGLAIADGDGPNVTMGASASFTYDINDPDQFTSTANTALYGSREQDESFNIDLVQIGLSGERGAVSYGAKIDLG